MKKSEPVTICNLCQSQNLSIKYKLSRFNILICKNCGLLMRDFRLDGLKTKKLYSQSYFCNLQKEYFSAGISQDLENSIRVKDFKEKLLQISKYSHLKSGSLLDIGCATGVFLKIAQDFGFQAQGVEVSNYAASVAQKKFGLKVFAGELNEAKLKPNQFDLITLWDMVDHVEDPVGLMNEVRKLVKKTGYIVIQTTMIDSLIYKLSDLVYFISFGKFNKLIEVGYPVHHSHHFSRTTLNKLLKQTGFKKQIEKNVEMNYEETSLPKILQPVLNLLGFLAKKLNQTIEVFILAQSK